jgi:hypothetical protein
MSHGRRTERWLQPLPKNRLIVMRRWTSRMFKTKSPGPAKLWLHKLGQLEIV